MKDLIAADKMMKKIKELDAYYIVSKELGSVRNWTLELRTDARLDNSDGERLYGAYVLLIEGRDGSWCPLSWGAKKIQTVIGSALVAETIAMQRGLSEAIDLRETLEEILDVSKKSLELRVLTDSESSYQAVKGNKSVGDKKLRRDMASIKQ